MKKLILALILAMVLSLTIVTPVFADDGKGPSNMPQDTADHLLDHVRGYNWWQSDGALINGLNNAASRAQGCVGYGVINNAWRVITIIAERGNPPGQGW